MRGVALAAIVLLGLGGCATLDRGADDKIYFVSVPPGASVTTADDGSCTTPCELDVSRRDQFTATIAKAGYAPQRVTIATRLNANGVGDFMEDVSTAGLGMVVDAATGATMEHIPNPVSVILTALSPAAKGKSFVRS